MYKSCVRISFVMFNKSINDTWPSDSFFIEHEKALSALPIFGKSLSFKNMCNIGKFDTAVETELIN